MMRPIEPGDVEQINAQQKQTHYKSRIAILANNNQLADCFSYLEGGVVVAVVGMQPHWEGRSALWSLIGNINNWVAFHRQAVELMHIYIKKNGIMRLEITTEEGFPESERWAKMLGFKEESLMKCFGFDGKDHKMWVRLWQQQ